MRNYSASFFAFFCCPSAVYPPLCNLWCHLSILPDNIVQICQVLDGQMLKVWTDRATEIALHGWFWEYELLNLAIDSVTVSADGRRATVEATLEESASLTDVAHPENNDSYSATYTTRYDMSWVNSGWKIVEGAVLKSR